jgi:EAL domain-containing protein (putative c-di-GMP-specific phosphodiesterase class I)
VEESLREIRGISPSQPLTLEIHEAAVTDLALMRALQSVLNELNIQLAYDDFGAGQARLIELIEVRPNYLKFDMQLVQGIHSAPAERQQMLATLVDMVRDLGISPLAEGVECEADSMACRQFGFEFGQGYYYGRPASLRHYSSGEEVRHP